MRRAEEGELLVVSGPPGAGKSTVTGILAAGFPRSALVEGDQFFGFVRQGWVPPWTEPAEQQNRVVTEAAAAASGRLAGGGYFVVYDGVVGPWAIDAFADACAPARVNYVVLLPPEEVAIERVRSRTGHGFTDLEAARHMYAQFRDAQLSALHLLVHDDGEADHLARVVRERLDAGSLAWTGRAR